MGQPQAQRAGARTPKRARTAWICAAYFVCAGIALVHPVYTLVANQVHPRIFGLPFSLTYILGWILANTAVLSWMYRSRVIDASEHLEPTEHSPNVGPGGADA